MNKPFFAGAFLLGIMAVVWVATGFFGSSNMLALMMTAVIAAVYVFGTLELHRFRQATASLKAALAALSVRTDSITELGGWLASVHASLQNPVRLRVEGERVGLPGPALTPYLVGLLVMLGMLGTFLGMVVTLNGAVFALEGTSDLQAIRTAFAAPIKGLGLAFGTSIAGVATSAMLGLMSAISRRERGVAGQLLDSAIATTLRSFSLTHQRQESFKALQLQSAAFPAVVGQLQAMMAQMASTSQTLNERLLSNQDAFHKSVKDVYGDLAKSVEQSLRDSLSHSAQAAAQSIRPVMETAMANMALEAQSMHERVLNAAQTQLAALSTEIRATASSVTDAWTAALTHQERSNAAMAAEFGLSLQKAVAGLQQEWQQMGESTLAQQQHICSTLAHTAQEITEYTQASTRQTQEGIARLMDSSESLVQARMASEAQWTQQHGTRMQEAVSVLHAELGALRDEEAVRGKAAVERLGELQAALTVHLTTLGAALEDPITRLIETASEAPRAAAEVIAKLRQEVSSSAVRDNEILEERSRILETLNALLESINHASLEQRNVIDALVASSAVALDQTGIKFAEQVDGQNSKLAEVAAQVTASAVEVSALSESFQFAVKAFHEGNEKLIANLQRIESAMDKSMLRSDEQLAYYVAQAREIIDLSIMSQKAVFEELNQLPAKQAQIAEEVA